MSQFGSFWSILNFAAHSSRIDDMLNNPETTLEQLLDDDNIITEFKSLNPKLLEYCTDDKIKALLQYIIEEPPADADRNRGYKYPFVSCEILTADISTIQSAFFGKNPNSNKQSNQNTHDSSNEFDDYQTSPVEDTNKGEEQEAESTEKKASDKDIDEVIDDVQNIVDKDKAPEIKITETKSEKSEEVETPVNYELANYFFSFLERKELNVTLMGYFTRFLHHLILRRPTEMAEFVWARPEIIESMIRHLEFRALAECLAKLFCLEGVNSHSGETYTDERLKMLAKLMDIFTVSNEQIDDEILGNASYVVCEIISKRSSLGESAKFENYFLSKDFLDIVFNNLFRHNSLTSHLTSIINALLQMFIQSKNASKNPSGDNDESENADNVITGSEADDNLLYDYLTSKIGEIAEFLQENKNAELNTTYGKPQKPFGTVRLKLVETILYAIKLNVNKISIEISLKNIFKILMDLMIQYEWNNLLHNLIEKIFVSTLESDSQSCKKKLLSQTSLLDFLNDSTAETTFTMPNGEKRNIRKGYLGHITKIARALEKLASHDKDIKEYINNEKWKKFEENYYKPSIANETYDLAGYSKKESDDFSDENIHSHFEDNIMSGKFNTYYSHGQDGGDEDIEEDDMNDREDQESPEKNAVNTNVDTLGEFEKDTETWTKKEASEVNQHAHSDKGLWSHTFHSHHHHHTHKFPLDDLKPPSDYSSFLELNRQLEIIDIGPQHETHLEEQYIENQYWARPNPKINIDDLLKEFESI